MPEWLMTFLRDNAQFVASMTVIFVILHLILGGAAYLILLERKICAWVQDRVGPNRVGPAGLLQPLADGVKLFVKEDFIPRGADRFLFVIAPALTVMPALISFVVIPWGGILQLGEINVKLVGADINIGIIYLVAVASLGVYGVALGGWASNSKYSFLGGLRASAQMVSYEIPMGLALLTVILTAGSVMPLEIVESQIGAGNTWYLLQQPLVAVLFFTCMLAEANRTPFDLAEAEAELVGGWHTEYSSMKWALFFMGEYAHVTVGSAFFTMLFLGGWSVNPVGFLAPFDIPTAGGILVAILQLSVTLGKVFLLICLTMMIRWTIPRFRFDQLMKLAWEGMIPAALLMLMVTSVFIYLGWTSYLWAGSLAGLLVIWFVGPMLPKTSNPNHRLPLIGSRFSPMPDGRSHAAGRAMGAGAHGVRR